MIAVMTPANGVFAPASKFTTERLNPPGTGNPPPRPLAIFATPNPIDSWFGWILSLRRAASVWPTLTVSTKPTIEIRNAAGRLLWHVLDQAQAMRVSAVHQG